MRFSGLISISALAAAVSGSSGFYSDDTNIYELTPQNFDNVVLRSNYTSIVEFYAPWCGYCKQLTPVYQKLAKYFQQDAKYAINVVSVNCDEDKNKALCSKYGVRGFPAIQIFRPPKFQRVGKTSGKHVPEVYNGARELPAMVEFVASRLKNYVKKFYDFSSKSLGEWLNVNDGLEKVVVLSGSDKISALLKSVAIDFLDTLSVGSIIVKSQSSNPVIKYGEEEIEVPLKRDDKLPILLVYKKNTKKFVRYDGKKLTSMNKIQKFISDNTGAIPSEGELSKRGKKLQKLRGVAKIVKDEL